MVGQEQDIHSQWPKISTTVPTHPQDFLSYPSQNKIPSQHQSFSSENHFQHHHHHLHSCPSQPLVKLPPVSTFRRPFLQNIANEGVKQTLELPVGTVRPVPRTNSWDSLEPRYDNLAVGRFMKPNLSPRGSVGRSTVGVAISPSSTMQLDGLVTAEDCLCHSPNDITSGLHVPSPSKMADPILSPTSLFQDPNACQFTRTDVPTLESTKEPLEYFSQSCLDLMMHDNLHSLQLPVLNLVPGNAHSPMSSELSSIQLSPKHSLINDISTPVSPSASTKMEPKFPSGCQETLPLPSIHSLSPFSAPFLEVSPNTSPRGSAKSSFHSSRGSRTNKRALSVSPLTAEGLDLNAIIRSSPTSLMAYINGSRSSSASISPSPGEKGSYGHLSARNSGSPYSNTSAHHQPAHISLSGQNLEIHNTDNAYYQMRQLEQGPYAEYIPLDNQGTLIDDNLQVIGPCPERTDDLDQVFLQSHIVPQHLPHLTLVPPPSYSQHMAAKQQHESSQQLVHSQMPQELIGEEEAPVQQACRWIDCNNVYTEQEELVKHIEKAHIDQRKGEDFTCFWQSCPRRYRPFNARYKLLIHMRVHSGEKPNKCTFEGCTKAFSRLENLKIHLRSHTGERPYVCQHSGCCKAFSNSSDRAKHQRTHLDTKPYACQIPGCNKRYTDPSSLRKHVKNHTTREHQTRKKLRGEPEPVCPELLSECLTIQPLRPRNQVTQTSSGDGGNYHNTRNTQQLLPSENFHEHSSQSVILPEIIRSSPLSTSMPLYVDTSNKLTDLSTAESNSPRVSLPPILTKQANDSSPRSKTSHHQFGLTGTIDLTLSPCPKLETDLTSPCGNFLSTPWLSELSSDVVQKVLSSHFGVSDLCLPSGISTYDDDYLLLPVNGKKPCTSHVSSILADGLGPGCV